jgi:hypothetical protein
MGLKGHGQVSLQGTESHQLAWGTAFSHHRSTLSQSPQKLLAVAAPFGQQGLERLAFSTEARGC